MLGGWNTFAAISYTETLYTVPRRDCCQIGIQKLYVSVPLQQYPLYGESGMGTEGRGEGDGGGR